MSPAKFYIITGTAALTLISLGFFAGRQQGREKFANECIAIGNFVVYDYGLEKKGALHARTRRWNPRS